jgi:hypothetical protein
MIVVRFRSNDEHEDLMKKVKKMKQFTEELEDVLEECYEEEEPEYRGSYRKHYDEEDMRMRGGRYSYRGGRM